MLLLYILLTLFLHQSYSQQPYINNKQNDCYNNYNSTSGNLCNGPQSCTSYLTFRSQPPYDTATQIARLLNMQPDPIVQINKNINDVDRIPVDTLVIIPVNCSCSGEYYQHNSSYTLKHRDETYFILANDTYQGLSTCQALIQQNPKHDSRNLLPGMKLNVPVRCACPTRKQSDNGVKFLLSYITGWKDAVPTISEAFGVEENDVYDANELSEDSLIFPFTPVLVPLKAQPVYKQVTESPPVLSPPPTVSATPTDDSNKKSSSKIGVFVGIGVGVVLLLVALVLLYVFCFRRKSQKVSKVKNFSSSTQYTPAYGNKSDSGLLSSRDVRYMIDNSSLNVYKFEELQRATSNFSEDNRIRGSVYRGMINGDTAAIKRMDGDALNEINVLKEIHHSSIIRLSGYSMHEGSVYLVYEFAEMGSLSDWLYESKSCEDPIDTITWKQRIQIAYDIADGLNYLHSYATPPYIHRDLKSSNILLNGGFRAKIANFGMARTVSNQENEGTEDALQLTKHVVGTQGYMAPEYIENGMVSPKMDVFAFGVVMLELLSGKEAVTFSIDEDKNTKRELLLFASVNQVLEGENVREKLRSFVDPSLKREYPLDLAFSMADLARNCVARDLNSRPTMYDVYISLSKMLSSSLDWDPSDELQRSSMVSH
ncbi:hypothetical protein ACHQM5_015686 [Ranunculus cassubicifolius]